MRFFGPRAAKCSAHLRLGDENVGESLNFFVWPCHNKQLNGITLQMAQRVVEKRAMEWFGHIRSLFLLQHTFSPCDFLLFIIIFFSSSLIMTFCS